MGDAQADDQQTKKKRTVSDVGIKVPKKMKASEPSHPTPTPPTTPLFLSSLRWKGEPTAFCADGEEPISFGKYIDAGKTSLSHIGWSSELMAHIYKPTSPYTFEYKRECYIGVLGSSYTYYGGLWGDPDPNPLLLVHRQDNTTPFTASCGLEEETISSPPFEFWTVSECDSDPVYAFQSHPPNPPTLDIQLDDDHEQAPNPKLAVNLADRNAEDTDAEDDFEYEEDSGKYLGFQESWTEAFITHIKEKRSLPILEKVLWTAPLPEEEGKENSIWGLKVNFVPIVRSTSLVEFEGKTRLAKYWMKATVLEVYVKQGLAVILDVAEHKS
jgi:hypothetical protein